jgi:hypothetical protein
MGRQQDEQVRKITGEMEMSKLTKSQLQSLATKHGWRPRPLTMGDIRTMSGPEQEYHKAFNAKAFSVANGTGFVKRDDLTMSDVNQMSLAEFDFYMANHRAFIEKIINAPTARKSAEAEIQKKWKEGGTDADNAAVFTAGNTFASRYPQYVADEANGVVVAQF